MNAHEKVMAYYGTPYACAKATGASYASCKRWWRKGCFIDPAWWARIADNDIQTMAALAADYSAAHPSHTDQEK